MSEIVVAIFPDVTKAHEAVQQLSDTAARDGINIHGGVASVEAKLDDIRMKLSPGTGALVVDLEERSLQAFSTRIHEVGGEVVSPGLKDAAG